MIEKQETDGICDDGNRDSRSLNQVLALLYQGRQLIGGESQINFEPLKDQVDEMMNLLLGGI